MARRAIEEEFDRIYSEFIENPHTLPRLKKRVKICRYPEEKASFSASPTRHSQHCPDLQVPSPIPYSGQLGGDVTIMDDKSKAVECDATSSSSKESVMLNEAMDAVEEEEEEEENVESGDLFLFHKPRINRRRCLVVERCVNLDKLWSVYARNWFHPRLTDTTQDRPAVFLRRNLHRGKRFHRHYLQQVRALRCVTQPKQSKSKLEAVSTERSTDGQGRWEPPKTGKSFLKRETGKAPNTEPGKAQKRKGLKPKATTSSGLKKKSKDHKPELHPSAKTKPTHKQMQKTEGAARKSSCTGAKKTWTTEQSRGKKIAICRPNAKKEMPVRDTASRGKRESDGGGRLAAGKSDSTPNPQTGQAHQREAEECSATTAGTRGGESGVKPLFTSEAGHCGGIWKSLVEEC